MNSVNKIIEDTNNPELFERQDVSSLISILLTRCTDNQSIMLQLVLAYGFGVLNDGNEDVIDGVTMEKVNNIDIDEFMDYIGDKSLMFLGYICYYNFDINILKLCPMTFFSLGYSDNNIPESFKEFFSD